MVRFLLARPIAVLMTFLALLVFSFIVFRSLPVSLLPPIDVPQILVKVNYPNTSPEAIEQNVLAPIRDGLMTLQGLQQLESKAGSGVGTLRLIFDYDTPMNLAYIDVNEKIDRITNSLPRDLQRPQVIRINTNDIPVVRVQVIPKEGFDFTDISLLTENVLKKRLEQLEGVSLVDINGRKQKVITVSPDQVALKSLGMTDNDLIQAIRYGNEELPGISVEDGQFRYYLRLATRVSGPQEILQLPVTSAKGVTVSLEKVASVKYEIQEAVGMHLFGEEEALVITVHKQARAKMNELLPKVYEAVDQFKVDYPQVDFDLTQDQSLLLNAGISNLQTSLIFGGLFAFAVLFIFMGNYRTPVIIGISLPSSLTISVLVFYFFDISINVISLAGLALGLGMLIDNAIIVLDNITRKRKEGLPLFEACVQGVNEVISALISSVLTTLAVFVPLVFLSGISGALFYDQAVSVAAILLVSLLVAFILLPLLYRVFFNGSAGKELSKEDSKLFVQLLKKYKSLYLLLFSHKKTSLLTFALLIPLGLGIGLMLDKEGLPPIEKNETLLQIDWNEPISVTENRNRIGQLLSLISDKILKTESEIGVQQFLMFNGESALQQAVIYLEFENQQQKQEQTNLVLQHLAQNYPRAVVDHGDAPNAFDQLFASDLPYFEVRWRDLTQKKPVAERQMLSMLEAFPKIPYRMGPGLQSEMAVVFKLDPYRMSLYGIEPNQLMEQIKRLFGAYGITDIKDFGEIIPITLNNSKAAFEQTLSANMVQGKDGNTYALSNFIEVSYDNQYKFVTADIGGLYQSVSMDAVPDPEVQQEIRKWAMDYNLGVSFVGQFFQDEENIRELIGILMVSILLLYFILSAQFESFLQPLIVIFTLPLGLGGAFLMLLITQTSLNIMSAIGLVVMLGIMVNDAILKIDTINRLRIKYAGEEKEVALNKALFEAGEIRLKPIIMTSITTVLALLPVAFSSGLGADLQRPLVYAVIGGLTIGTFTSLYFVPLAYWLMARPKLEKIKTISRT